LAHATSLRGGDDVRASGSTVARAVDENDVDARELGQLLHLLKRHLADVRHELERQLRGLHATVAAAEAIHLELATPPEKPPPDRRDLVREGGEVRTLFARERIEEGRVSLELRELEAGLGGVDQRLEQLRHDILRVREVHAVHLHEPRVAPDVRDEKDSALDGHGGILHRTPRRELDSTASDDALSSRSRTR